MRLLFVSRFYHPESFGGYEFNCRRMATALAARGHAVTVLSRPLPKPLQNGPNADGTIRTLADVGSGEVSGLEARFYQARVAVANRRAAAAMQRELRRSRPDVVVFWGSNVVVQSPVRVVRDAGVPFAFDVGDYWLRDALAYGQSRGAARQLFWRLLLGGRLRPAEVRHAIVHSEFMRRVHVDVGVAAAETVVIGRPLIPEFIERARAWTPGAPPRFRLLYVGRVVPDKGLHVAIEALQRLASSDGRGIDLHVYGDGLPDYVARLKAMAPEVSGRCTLTLHGGVAHDRVPDLYASHDALLFPVIWDEPSSNVILEAAAAGLPILATRSGSVPEFVHDGENGILVPRNDAAALAQGLQRLDSECERLRRDAEPHAARIRAAHAPDVVVDATERYLLAVADKRGLVG